MGTLFVYILKSGTALALFYLFYRLLLSKETFHRFNRMALLGITGLSAMIPFIHFTISGTKQLQTDLLSLPVVPVTPIEEIVLPAIPVVPLCIYILIGIYNAGLLFFSLRTVFSFVRLARLFRHECTSFRHDNITVYLTDEEIAPFSWMNRVVISRKDWEENGDAIFSHELGHIRSFHSWDVLFIQLAVILQWFNPAAWLVKQELQNIHEYEADEYVLRKGIEAKRYQLLLIEKAVGSQRFTSMANSFNHSKLKKRITMMLKVKSNPWARMKYLYILPVTIMVTSAFAHPDVSEEMSRIANVKISEILPETKEPQQDSGIIQVKTDSGQVTVVGTLDTPDTETPKPLVILDGEEISFEVMEQLDPACIQSIHVLKDESSIQKYGEKGEGGVIQIVTINGPIIIKGNIPVNPVYTQEKENKNVVIDDRKASQDEIEKIQLQTETLKSPGIAGLVEDPEGPGSDKQVITDLYDPKTPVDYYLDGKQITRAAFEILSPASIESVSILQPDWRTGKNGVVLITTKNRELKIIDTLH